MNCHLSFFICDLSSVILTENGVWGVGKTQLRTPSEAPDFSRGETEIFVSSGGATKKQDSGTGCPHTLHPCL
ncbi:hypothetical protein H6G76_08965 [Nostoc sp. FACHB-152]|nr:hypothetical protein [Nostoc sp. FACHB-152]MBD2468104.1 hypothetical protein [Nostoc sp. FACHB-145]